MWYSTQSGSRPLRETAMEVAQLRGMAGLTKAKRCTTVVHPGHRYGYTQREVAEFLGWHYATVSRLANRP